jgi:hypothetical protein
MNRLGTWLRSKLVRRLFFRLAGRGTIMKGQDVADWRRVCRERFPAWSDGTYTRAWCRMLDDLEKKQEERRAAGRTGLGA